MNAEKSKFPRRGEIWIADYNFKFSDLHSKEQDFTIESLIKKSRPCVIVSNNIHNEFSDLVITVPLTSYGTTEVEEPLEVLVKASRLNNLDKDSKALITYLSHFDKSSRLKKLVGIAGEEVMTEVTKKLTKLII